MPGVHGCEAKGESDDSDDSDRCEESIHTITAGTGSAISEPANVAPVVRSNTA